jgi:hypothetical protein
MTGLPFFAAEARGVARQLLVDDDVRGQVRLGVSPVPNQSPHGAASGSWWTTLNAMKLGVAINNACENGVPCTLYRLSTSRSPRADRAYTARLQLVLF